MNDTDPLAKLGNDVVFRYLEAAEEVKAARARLQDWFELGCGKNDPAVLAAKGEVDARIGVFQLEEQQMELLLDTGRKQAA